MEIKEIKARLGISELIAYYGYRPTKTGLLKCPFHTAEKKCRKKQLQIFTDSNRFQCFQEGCVASKNGDVLDFIQHEEKCNKHEAILIAKKILGVESPNKSNTSSSISTPSSETEKSEKEEENIKNARSDENNQLVKPSGECSPKAANGQPQKIFKVVSKEEIIYINPPLEVKILGGIKIDGLDKLRVTLKLGNALDPTKTLRNSLDLYYDDQLQKMIRKAGERLELSSSLLGESLNDLINYLEDYRLEERQKLVKPEIKLKPLTVNEQEVATDFLRSSDLLLRTNEELGKSGIVGEELNRLILYLVYTSRKRQTPLHVICLGASGTGKTYLQEKVSGLIPENEVFSFTASTENAFYYLKPRELCNKVVLVEDMDGASSLLYSLRELQTKQWIKKIVPLKDALGGEIGTRPLEVYGPICLSGTTTQERIYEDNANRCLLIYLDNSEQQEESIMAYQRKLSAGTINEYEEEKATQLLKNIQRILKPIKVINPYAEQLKIPKECFKPLRTHSHYLQFIETVTYYHQYQRKEYVNEETGEVFIKTTIEDIKAANELLKDILLAKSDPLPKAVREFFEGLKTFLKMNNTTTFYGKELINKLRMYPMKVSRYLGVLESFGVIRKVGGNKKKGYEYEILEWREYNTLKEGMSVLDALLEGLE